GAAVRLDQVAAVSDSVEDIRTVGLADTKPAVLIILFRQPGANIIETVDRVRALMPELEAEVPPAMNLAVVMDRTTTIRASVHDVQLTLMLSIGLVILVVFVFLRNLRATLIPSVAVPISLVGTFGVMYLCGYSIDNLSLMSVTIAVSMVVSLTTTPMMCARLLRHKPEHEQSRLYRWSERLFERLVGFYDVTLAFVLRHPLGTLLVLLATVGLTIYLYATVP